MPAGLAALVLLYLVPPAGQGFRGAVALLGQRYPLYFGLALYFVFSAVARYWRHRFAGVELGATPEAVEVPATPVLEWRKHREILVLVAMVVGAAGLAYAFRWRVARPYRVLSSSMLPTLEPNDLIAGRIRPYGSAAIRLPLRGDVVVFQSAAVVGGPGAGGPEALVKRVIGLPGDRIGMRGSVPMINGWLVPSCDAGEYLYALPTFGDRGLHGRLRVEFLEDRAYLAVYAMGALFLDTYVVKPGEVFVLGDNRGNSLDSRAYNAGRGGGVPLDAIEARAQRFLFGTHRSGDMDFGRLLRPIDALQARLRLEAVDTQPLDEGIARCLKVRPTDTRPPPP